MQESLQGWRSVLVTDTDHPYMDRYWVPGCTIGYEHTFINAVGDFLACLERGQRPRPDFADALDTQRVCDAVIASANEMQWKTLR